MADTSNEGGLCIMNGYDIIEALGEAADEYVEEIERRGELRGLNIGCYNSPSFPPSDQEEQD